MRRAARLLQIAASMAPAAAAVARWSAIRTLCALAGETLDALELARIGLSLLNRG